MLLPHDRVGSDFSWLQPQSRTASKAQPFEDEEWFLYGDEKAKKEHLYSQTSTTRTTGELVKPQWDEMKTWDLGSQQHNRDQSNSRLLDGFLSSRQVFANLDNNECEKIKMILNNLTKTNCNEIGKQLPPEWPLSSTAASLGLSQGSNMRSAMESLQSLFKGERIFHQVLRLFNSFSDFIIYDQPHVLIHIQYNTIYKNGMTLKSQAYKDGYF